jgi:hypothetical protein
MEYVWKLDRFQNPFECSGEEKKPYPLPGIEQQFLGRPIRDQSPYRMPSPGPVMFTILLLRI